ncbi:heme exporter protein CcmD [Phocoenobacter atlanticus]|uniref:heme exporter protein CcmD n=1 Tax=Phocoenobacter atlanticus TaxID=3416742 RepID=UPI00276F22EC|nr:heme exporter protein CcmD [Pasteurella atlantica]MDP8101568.1 heme exporter protein CcmD [Pasteurella atlantica]
MFFQSWSDFFNMGGYGFYIWLAYGISFVALLGLAIQGMMSKKSLIKEIQREQQRKKRQQQIKGI